MHPRAWHGMASDQGDSSVRPLQANLAVDPRGPVTCHLRSPSFRMRNCVTCASTHCDPPGRQASRGAGAHYVRFPPAGSARRTCAGIHSRTKPAGGLRSSDSSEKYRRRGMSCHQGDWRSTRRHVAKGWFGTQPGTWHASDTAAGAIAAEIELSLVGPVGLEPTTYGLKVRPESWPEMRRGSLPCPRSY